MTDYKMQIYSNRTRIEIKMNKQRKILLHSDFWIISLINKKKKKLIFSLIFLENKFNNRVIKSELAIKKGESTE